MAVTVWEKIEPHIPAAGCPGVGGGADGPRPPACAAPEMSGQEGRLFNFGWLVSPRLSQQSHSKKQLRELHDLGQARTVGKQLHHCLLRSAQLDKGGHPCRQEHLYTYYLCAYPSPNNAIHMDTYTHRHTHVGISSRRKRERTLKACKPSVLLVYFLMIIGSWISILFRKTILSFCYIKHR